MLQSLSLSLLLLLRFERRRAVHKLSGSSVPAVIACGAGARGETPGLGIFVYSEVNRDKYNEKV